MFRGIWCVLCYLLTTTELSCQRQLSASRTESYLLMRQALQTKMRLYTNKFISWIKIILIYSMPKDRREIVQP